MSDENATVGTEVPDDYLLKHGRTSGSGQFGRLLIASPDRGDPFLQFRDMTDEEFARFKELKAAEDQTGVPPGYVRLSGFRQFAQAEEKPVDIMAVTRGMVG